MHLFIMSFGFPLVKPETPKSRKGLVARSSIREYHVTSMRARGGSTRRKRRNKRSSVAWRRNTYGSTKFKDPKLRNV
jgi:hypothetical protein